MTSDKNVCPNCQISFAEFRGTGRLGCPYDYEIFRDELMPLLENIHDEIRHSGKVPRRAPRNSQQQTTLIQLRNDLKRAIAAEDYEAAARIRDDIKNIEQEQRAVDHARDRHIGPPRTPLESDGPPMTCQRCRSEATVHLTESVDGQRREVHLCAPCARESGVLPAEDSAPPPKGIDAVVQGLIVANVGELVGELAGLTCPDCGLKFMEYRAQGRLGCPNDYAVFSKGMLPLLLQVHGATRHVGKPARPRPEAARRLQLRARLRSAVVREDYEEAARLRDLLRLKDADA